MENSFIHIGYPKCASTAIQLGLFASHPDIFFLGPLSAGRSFEYYNANVKRLVEVEWRIMKDFGYDKDFARDTIRGLHLEYLRSGKKVLGLSFEGLSLTVQNDIDITQKASRLAEAFQGRARIIIIIRNQFELIKSLYKNYILIGSSASYYKFVTDAVYNHFGSFALDLDYFKMFQLYEAHFGRENVLVLPVEYLRLKPAQFCQTLADHIGVRLHVTNLPRANESRIEAFYEHLRDLNATYRHGVGVSAAEPTLQHRYVDYFGTATTLPPPESMTFQTALHEALVRMAAAESASSDRGVVYEMPAAVYEWLVALFKGANSKLATALGLPLKELGYPFPAT